MDEAKKEQIAKLAADACEKRMQYDALSMRNAPTDPDERKKLAAEYAIAQAEVQEAEYLLECAKDPKPREVSAGGNLLPGMYEKAAYREDA